MSKTRCKAARLGINPSKAAMLRNVIIGRTRRHAMLLAMITTRKEFHGFYACMRSCTYSYGAPLAALRVAGAPL